MSKIDFARAASLLAVVKAVAENGGMHAAIAQVANRELAEMARMATEELKPAPEPVAKAEPKSAERRT